MTTVRVGEYLRPAVEAMQSGQLQHAEAICKDVLKERPDDLGAIHMLSTLAMRRGALTEATAYFNKGLSLAADEPTMLSGLASVRTLEGRFDEAMALYEKSLKAIPDNHVALAGKVGLLERLGRIKEADELLAPLVENGTSNAQFALLHARVQAELGQPEAALETIEGHLGNTRMSDELRQSMLYTRARLLDQQGRYEAAWSSLIDANEIGRVPFNLAVARRTIDTIIEVYSRERFEKYPRANTKSELMVFVASMPRSGSTLVEHILASHPQVHGIGESTELLRRANEVSEEIGESIPYPPAVARLTQESVNRLSSRYLSRVRALAPDQTTRIVDKHLRNVMMLGFAELLLPNARVIYIKRNPLDTCLSCFMAQLNPAAHPYTTDVRNAASFLLEYERLMRHWAGVLNLPMLTIEYEDLVADQERITRQMLEFCDLPWDDRCLRFFEHHSAAATASYDQVRKPMYDSAVGRWKHYDAYLKPAKDLLESTVSL